MNSRRTLFVCLLAGIAIVAIACGEDNRGLPASNPTQSVAPTVPPTRTPVPTATQTILPTATADLSQVGGYGNGTRENTADATPASPESVVTPQTATPTSSGPSDIVPEPGTPPGTALVAIPFLPGRSGLNSAMADSYGPFLGFGESLFLRSIDETPQSWLATSFEIDSDGSGVTITISDGVPFHSNNGDFGNLTAADVAWSMNQANHVTNPDSAHQHSNLFGDTWQEWEVVDDTTISFQFKSMTEDWATQVLNQMGAMFTVFSQQAFNEMGERWARENVVATGPYEIEEWVDQHQVILVSRYAVGERHHIPALTPQTERVTIFQVPEDVTRVAIIRNGYADAAIIRPEEVEWLVAGGFRSTASSHGDALVFNPKKIASWDMGRTGESPIGDIWNLTLQPER